MASSLGAWADSKHPRDEKGRFATSEGDSASKDRQKVRDQIAAYKATGAMPKGWDQGHVGHYSETSVDDLWSQQRGVKAGEWTQHVYSFAEKPGDTVLKAVPFDEVDKMLAAGSGSKEHPWDFPAMKRALEKQLGTVKAKPGEQVVYRLGNKGTGGLTNKNAGNLEAVITFAASQSSGTRGHVLRAYSVKLPKVQGDYIPYRGNKPPSHYEV
jgi:hypothetical protein